MHPTPHLMSSQRIRNRRLDEALHVEACATIASVTIVIPTSSTPIPKPIAVPTAIIAIPIIVPRARCGAARSAFLACLAFLASAFLPFSSCLAPGTSIAIVITPSSAPVAVPTAVVAIAVVVPVVAACVTQAVARPAVALAVVVRYVVRVALSAVAPCMSFEACSAGNAHPLAVAGCGDRAWAGG